MDENSHRADDKHFLMVHTERCSNISQFLYKKYKDGRIHIAEDPAIVLLRMN